MFRVLFQGTEGQSPGDQANYVRLLFA
jgi:hypothetical protein